MSAIDDLRQLSELLGKVERAHITVLPRADNLAVYLHLGINGGETLQASAIDLANVVRVFRPDIIRMILQRLEARIHDLLPAAKREYDDARELLANANRREAVLRMQRAESARERQAT